MKLFMFCFIKIFSIFCLVSLSNGRDIEHEYTITVKPSQSECFFQDILAGEKIDIEYQVIDGGQGNLDITFFLMHPHGTILIHDVKKSDGNHRANINDDGHYKLCWDNTFSSFSSKTVFFAIMIDGNNEDDLWGDQNSSYEAEEFYEIKVEDIKHAIDQIRTDLTKARYYQDQLMAHEARDRNIAENNYTRVNLLSMINISAMLVTGFMQVLLVRSLFDEKSRLHKVWKKYR